MNVVMNVVLAILLTPLVLIGLSSHPWWTLGIMLLIGCIWLDERAS